MNARPPELSPAEERGLNRMIELAVDDFIEAKHFTEVPAITEGLGIEL